MNNKYHLKINNKELVRVKLKEIYNKKYIYYRFQITFI